MGDIAAAVAPSGDISPRGPAHPTPIDWLEKVAAAIGASLVVDRGEGAEASNVLAGQALGTSFEGTMAQALEHLTRAQAHRLDVAALLRRAALEGSAQGRVDGQLVWVEHTSEGVAALVQGTVSRSSAPPPDEVAALRHELANAMTAIAALAAQAEREGDLEAALRGLARIRTVADAAVTGTRRHGAPASADAGRDVSREASEFVADLVPFAAERHVRVEARIEPGLRALVGSASLRLVIWNLLKNAIEASPMGSTVVVSVGQREGSLRVTVEDMGPGLTAELRRRVFEPHFSTKDEGRGLGLSLVQAEVERAGGGLEVTGRERGGARFSVSLPGAHVLPHEPEATAESSGVLSSRPLEGVRVYLLCDLVFLERALMAFGAEVWNTSEAQLAQVSESADVLIADGSLISFPDAARLRARGVVRRVIYLATEHDRVPQAGPHATTLDVVLGAGFEMRELADAVQAVLAEKSEVG